MFVYVFCGVSSCYFNINPYQPLIIIGTSCSWVQTTTKYSASTVSYISTTVLLSNKMKIELERNVFVMMMMMMIMMMMMMMTIMILTYE